MSTTKKGPPKVAKIREGVDDIVLQWFKENNKPATAQGVVDALGSRVTKATCQKSLDSLVESCSLIAKEIKKAKYYYLDQQKLTAELTAAAAAVSTSSSASKESTTDEKDEVSQELVALREKYISLMRERHLVEAQRVASFAMRTHAESADLLQKATDALQSAQERLSILQVNSGAGHHVPGEFHALTERYSHFRSLWKQRKMLCEKIVDAVVGEGPVQELVDSSGIVLDSDVGTSLEGTAVNFKKRSRT